VTTISTAQQQGEYLQIISLRLLLTTGDNAETMAPALSDHEIAFTVS
jgi:hypothetical protein